MTFTRLTIVGETRRVDLVVPDDEPFGAVLPDVLDLLGESTRFAGAPVRLVTRTGAQIELAATPAEQGVPHGDVLRIVRAEEAPPPPEVADVTDVVAESLVSRGDRWSEPARVWTGAVAVAVAIALIGFAVIPLLGTAAIATLAAVWAVALAGAVVAGRFDRTWSRLWTTAIAVGAGAPLALEVALRLPPVTGSALLVGSALTWAAIGVGLGLAARSAAPAWGGLAGVVASTLWLGLSYTLLPSAAIPAFLGVAGLVVIGMLPSIALAISGLSALDDAAIGGALPARRAVAASLDDAYAALAWLGVALAITVGAAGIALAAVADVYALLLAVAIGLVLALRTRQFPLVIHVVPLWIGAVGVFLAVAASPLLPPVAGAAVLVALGVGAVVLVGLRPSAHARVRLRRWGNVVELVAVVATVPLLLGVLGVYPDLLAVFP